MKTNWIGIATLYKRETWRFLKVWNQTLIAPMITTLIFLAVLTLAMGGNVRMVHGMPFTHFIAPGLIMMAMVQNAFANTSSSFLIAKLQGVIIDWLLPPFSAGELVVGMVAGGITRGLMVGCTVSLAMSIFTHVDVHSVGALLFFAVAATAMMSLLGIVTGIVSNTPDQAATITNFVVTPLSFLSGTFYSIHDLPPLWQHISHFNPFFYMIDGFRFAMTGTSDGDPMLGATVLLATILVLWTLAQTMFARGYRLKS
jgi:ABC-2 type transport system permease protein